MYVPTDFEETRPEELHRIIREFPLGVLVLQGPDGLVANHLPFELNPDDGEFGHLIAHVARANPVWQVALDGQEVLVIFRAADAYISPNWYPSKLEDHRQVPTWNYQAVHAHGKIRIRDDEKFVRGVVAHLTRVNEGRASQEGAKKPWKMTDAPEDYIARMLQAIVGIEIRISRLIGKWKLSQNREPADRTNVSEELGKRGDFVTAAAMRDTLAD
jgi:transcriptional regulator